MNTEEELYKIVGKACVGVGAVPEKNVIIVFFHGASLAVRFEHGVLTWEIYEDTEH